VGVISVCPIGLEDRAINSFAPARPGKKSLRGSSNKRIKNTNEKKPTENALPIVTCEAETKLIGDYLSDDLGTSHRRTFEHHLKACPECVAFLATYKKTIEITRNYLNFAAAREQTPKLTWRAPFAAERRH
jgi:hypothetical protein